MLRAVTPPRKILAALEFFDPPSRGGWAPAQVTKSLAPRFNRRITQTYFFEASPKTADLRLAKSCRRWKSSSMHAQYTG
jgi:hypothetical protein